MTTEQKNKRPMSRMQQYIMLGAMASLGVVLLLIGNGNDDIQHTATIDNSAVAAAANTQTGANSVEQMERKLAYTLSQIQGAGAVTVQITVEHMGRKEYAVDTQRTNRTTTEQSGETNQQTVETQEQTTVVQQNQNGAQQPLLVSETAPEIAGVLVVASGACDTVVQEQLLHAVTAVLQIPMHQVVVVPGEERAS